MSKRKIKTPAQEFLDAMPHNMKDTEPRECHKEGCFKVRLGYGYPGGDKISCKDHKVDIDGLVDQGPKCSYKGCDKRGHNSVQDTRYRFCAPHRKLLVEEGMPTDDLKVAKGHSRKCVKEGCDRHAGYDNKTYCVDHTPTGQSDDKRRCDFTGCTNNQRPTFGFGSSRNRCKVHKEDGMVSHKACKHKGCTVSASYGPGGGVDVYCNTHRPSEYVLNVITCADETCARQPSYGLEGGVKYTHCSIHKPDGYVDVRNKRCIYEGCTKNRSFGVKGEDRLWCHQHKTNECINLVETGCAMACCVYGDACQAKFFHPGYMNTDSEFYKKRICYFARRVLIENAIMNNDMDKVELLLDHFDLNKVITLNEQSAFRFVCEKEYYKKLEDCVQIIFDQSVKNGLKALGDKRPDIFYKWCVSDKHYGIHIEYDEKNTHEDEVGRLEYIAKEACCPGRVYLVRVNGGHGGKDPVCSRIRMQNFEYYKVTDKGKGVASRVADAVKERIAWIKAGLSPDDEAGRPYKVYF